MILTDMLWRPDADLLLSLTLYPRTLQRSDLDLLRRWWDLPVIDQVQEKSPDLALTHYGGRSAKMLRELPSAIQVSRHVARIERHAVSKSSSDRENWKGE
jgi:hypothetical protein